jgi:hypothetical protein
LRPPLPLPHLITVPNSFIIGQCSKKNPRMTTKRSLAPIERIERAILLIRNHKVMLDADLAKLYGVSTKRLNEQVKRNRDRFPLDFMFQFTLEEKAEVVAICDHLHRLKFSPSLPYAFTEHGAVMLASTMPSSKWYSTPSVS